VGSSALTLAVNKDTFRKKIMLQRLCNDSISTIGSDGMQYLLHPNLMKPLQL
jgi:hypothetical protein